MNQLSLKGMLEFTAGCGFLFAVVPTSNLALYSFSFAVLAIWSLRASRWAIRWLLVNWLGACSSIFLGLACFEQASVGEPGYQAVDCWLLCGLGLIVWGLLAGVNGLPFLAESFCCDRTGGTETRPRRNVAT